MKDEQKLRQVFDSLFANQNQINMQILQRVWFRNVLYYLGEQWFEWVRGQNDDVIDVIDLKTGRGVIVSASETMQPAQYGIGAIDLFEDVPGYGPFSRIRIHIVQTRAGIAPTVHEYNREELEEKRLRLRAAAEEVYAGGVLQPSEKACRFCRASGDCLAFSEWSLVRLVGHFEDLEEALTKVDTLEAKPELLSGDQVAAILDKLSVVEAWIANMRSGAQKRALRGERIPGRKLVLSTKHRKWLDENAALAALLAAGVARSDCIKESLFSPAQAEKALGKSHPVLADFVVIPPGAG